jgi:preprotein translocase subunit SecD
MLDFPRWKVWLVSLTVLVGILLAVPSLLPEKEVERWPDWIPSARINLGLDIAGGSQLLLEADLEDASKQRLQAKEDEVTTELRRGEPRIDFGDVSTSGPSRKV